MANEIPQTPDPALDASTPPASGYTVTGDAWKEAGLSESFITKDGLDLKALGATLTEAQTMKAQAEERAKAVPADGKYDLALPKDFKAPNGIDPKSWKISEEWAAAVAPALKELGLTQSDVSKLVAAVAMGDAAKKIAQEKAEQERENAEVKALGETGKTRLENLEKAIQAAGYGALLDDKSTLAQRLEAFEKIINSGAKMAPNSGGNNGKERPEFDKLSGAQMHRLALQEPPRS